jgi:hypothetical protein
MDVSIAVGNVRKTVRVFGDRRWRVTAAGTYAMSQPVPFETMPLVWERAYGGSDETPKGPVAETRNPVGVGFCSPKGNRQPVDLLVPNLEDPNSPIRSWKDTPPPTCFAPICEHWQPRLSYAGTYDQHWQTQRAPYLPADFDSRFFQLSPPGLIVDGHLRGGEWIEVIGATPSGLLQFRLPTDAPKIAFLLDGTEQLRPADLDTVIIEPDIQRVVLVWRAMLSCDKKALRVTEVRAGIQHAA